MSADEDIHPAERLWEKLAFNRDKLPLENFDLSTNDGWKRFVDTCPVGRQIVEEVEAEFHETLCEPDAIWAVSQLLYGCEFVQYNARHGKSLSPKP